MEDNRISAASPEERTASICGLIGITDGTTKTAATRIASSAKIAMRVDVLSATSETTVHEDNLIRHATFRSRYWTKQ